MSRETILFADNDPVFLETRSEFLRQKGYKVLTTTCPTEARELFRKEHIDLAIFDARLEDDADEKDFSGLVLARRVDPSVPKIILTGFPSVATVRLALGPDLEGIKVAVDFVAKMEGPEALLQAVEEVLSGDPLRERSL